MTLQEWRHQVEDALSKANFDNPFYEAKWLLAGALKRESAFISLHPTYTPSPEEDIAIQEWLERRLQGEPLSRIKGFREFWSLPFHLNEHTLDPRPETELLVEGVLKWVGSQKIRPWRILDLGTGSGCLLISLLHELKEATGLGLDISNEAILLAQKNAVLNKVNDRATFRQNNWGKGLHETFDIIVSNPPYIPLKDKNTLEKAVLHYDPLQALFGGEDGLECYRILTYQIRFLLAPQGLAILEIGKGQRQDVETLFQTAGFGTLFILKDLAGIERAIGMESLNKV